MQKKLHYVLFLAAPNTVPPFNIELGFAADEKENLTGCAHIPDAITKLNAYMLEHNIGLSEQFTLIYPIYLEAMNTEHEMTMHNIAWLIKDEADKKGWQFDRIGGYTGRTTSNFIR